MHAQELRIGNYILEDGKIKQVYSLYEYDERGVNGVGEMYEAGKYTYPDCQPIPLTEEWLVKFGFEKINDSTWIYIIAIYQSYYGFDYKLDILSDNLITIKNVHTLQNLYFAITGTELTYTQAGQILTN